MVHNSVSILYTESPGHSSSKSLKTGESGLHWDLSVETNKIRTKLIQLFINLWSTFNYKLSYKTVKPAVWRVIRPSDFTWFSFFFLKHTGFFGLWFMVCCALKFFVQIKIKRYNSWSLELEIFLLKLHPKQWIESMWNFKTKYSFWNGLTLVYN